MGKQSQPQAIARITNSIERQDAEELYSILPKRILFDALWDSVAVRLAEQSDKYGTVEDIRADTRTMVSAVLAVTKAHK